MKRAAIRIFAIALTITVMCISSCVGTYPASNEEEIVEFLSGCGITVSGSASTKTVTIPAEFGEVYENYNELQRSQGFDLYNYRSREAEVWTFAVASVNGVSSPYTEAHVMVCDNIVIGGDLSSPALDGGMSPLRS